MLSRVKIQNFKSIGEPGVDLELKPLTFLVGPNGGGKSSILEAIGVAAQGGPMGQSADLPTWEDMLYRPGDAQGLIDIHFIDFADPELNYRLRIEHGHATPMYVVDSKEIPDGDHAPMLMRKHVLEVLGPYTFLIYSTRGVVPYRRLPDEVTWVGLHGEHTLIILERLAHAEHTSPKTRIQKWATTFGMSHVAASLASREQLEGSYRDDKSETPLNLNLASSGSRQILPVIVQLFWAPEGSLLMIEEPELSLHPQAQIDVLEMFAEAIKGNKQIIATTHGLFMIQAIGYAVQKGWLEREQIAVYHIEKKKDTGTTAKQLPLNERGHIKGWIPSFTRVERKLLKEWADTLPEA